MPQIRIDAPAKLNLHLSIGEKRPDGFHEIESLFLALAFGDTLCIETPSSEAPIQKEADFHSKDTEIILDWRLPWGSAQDIPTEKNIVNKAVSLFRSRTGFDKRLKIVLEKRIPPGGGLGGGSSDAAAALLALNRLASPEGLLGDEALFEMGASLGSDISFFLQIASHNAPEHQSPIAWVTGRGERVQTFTLPQSAHNLSFVLVNPGFPSDTADAFRLLDEYRDSNQGNSVAPRLPTPDSRLPIPHSLFPIPHSSFLIPHSSLLTAHCSLLPFLSNSPRDWPFMNDFAHIFWAVLTENKPYSGLFTDYQKIFSALMELGADFSGLSGSGSTCFGVFSSQIKADIARESLLRQWNFVIHTFPLALKTIQWYNIQ